MPSMMFPIRIVWFQLLRLGLTLISLLI